MQLTASNIASDTHIHLKAKGDVVLDAAINSQDSQTHTHTKKSGVFSSSATAITLGKQITKTDDHHKKITHTGNQLAALGGNVIIEAGDKYEQIASKIYAADNTKTINNPDAGNVLIKAQEAHITNATSTNTNHNAFYQKTSGVTASVSSTAVDSAKSIDGLIDATQESQSTRLKAMGVLAAAAKTKNLLDQAKQGSLSSIRAQATLGTSTNKNQSTSSHQSNQASTINTDGNLIFNIQGKGTDSDLVITGSHINVGNNLYQKVAGDVIYQASAQTSTTNTQNSSKSAGFGVYASANLSQTNTQGSAGFTAHASLGKGNSTENATTHTNTTVKVAGATHNDIAGNFILDGANLTTKHLTGTLGGDLIVKSRQDTYQYDSKQQNISGSADIDFSGKLQNANINAGKQQLNAQYAQVTNQSGIIANTSSLNVQGQGNFTGGYLITDTNQNHTQFKQGIQTQDIHNHLNYQGDALQVGVSIAPNSKESNTDQQDSSVNKANNKLGLSGLGYGKIDPIHKTSITKSAITDQAGLSHINTGNLSSKDSQQALNPIISNDFTNQKSQLEKELGGQVTITTEFDGERRRLRSEYAKEAEDRREEAKNLPDGDPNKLRLEAEAQKIERNIRLFDGLTSALYTPNTGGAVGDVVRAVSPHMAYKIGQYFKSNDYKNTQDNQNRPGEQSLQHLMAHAILGAATSYATGQDIGIGALSAVSSETAAPALSKFLFGKDSKELTQDEKDTITNIITLATASTAYAITDGDVANSVSAAEVGRVGVGNNDHDRLLPNGTSYHPGDRVRFSDEEALFIKDAIGFVVTPIGFLDAYHNAKTDEDKALAVATAFKIPIGKARTYVQKAKTKQNTRVGHEPDNDLFSNKPSGRREYYNFNLMSKQESEKIASEIKKRSPIQAPTDATQKIEQKAAGYAQIKYTWVKNGVKYESRWHTRTPGAPANQTNSWVVTRKKMGSKTQKGGETEYLLNDGRWITESKWNNALKLRKQGRETKESREILDRGHIKDVE